MEICSLDELIEGVKRRLSSKGVMNEGEVH
jgi:hypothetical protein